MDNNKFSPRQPETITLDLMRFNGQSRIPDSLMRHMIVEVAVDVATRDLLIQIEGKILSKEARSETMPDVVTHEVTKAEVYLAFASWWDHAKFTFRARFPKIGRRLIIKNIVIPVTHLHRTIQRVTKVYHLCPHLEQDPHVTHMRFMTLATEEENLFSLAEIERRVFDRYPDLATDYMRRLVRRNLLNVDGDTPERRSVLRDFLHQYSHLEGVSFFEGML